MRLRREATIGIASILCLQIILSALVIAILMRMGPAIDHILEENVSSEAAVEEMLASLAQTETPSDVPPLFEDALTRAKNNITQEGEQELVNQVNSLKVPAFQGESTARIEIIHALQGIGDSNRVAMDDANHNAKGLGEAGAWAAALLGAMSLVFGIYAYRRLLLRIEHPVDNIISTLTRIRAGNHQARCTISDAPSEIQMISNELNWVVDQWQKALHQKAFSTDNNATDGVSRRLLCAVVDQYNKPLVIKDQKGNIVATNHLAIGLDSSDWIEKPLIKTEYTFFIPPEDTTQTADLVKSSLSIDTPSDEKRD